MSSLRGGGAVGGSERIAADDGLAMASFLLMFVGGCENLHPNLSLIAATMLFQRSGFAAWNRFIRAAYNRQAAKVEAKVIKCCQDSGSAVDFMAILTLFHLRFQVLLLFLPPSSRA